MFSIDVEINPVYHVGLGDNSITIIIVNRIVAIIVIESLSC